MKFHLLVYLCFLFQFANGSVPGTTKVPTSSKVIIGSEPTNEELHQNLDKVSELLEKAVGPKDIEVLSDKLKSKIKLLNKDHESVYKFYSKQFSSLKPNQQVHIFSALELFDSAIQTLIDHHSILTWTQLGDSYNKMSIVFFKLLDVLVTEASAEKKKLELVFAASALENHFKPLNVGLKKVRGIQVRSDLLLYSNVLWPKEKFENESLETLYEEIIQKLGTDVNPEWIMDVLKMESIANFYGERSVVADLQASSNPVEFTKNYYQELNSRLRETLLNDPALEVVLNPIVLKQQLLAEGTGTRLSLPVVANSVRKDMDTLQSMKVFRNINIDISLRDLDVEWKLFVDHARMIKDTQTLDQYRRAMPFLRILSQMVIESSLQYSSIVDDCMGVLSDKFQELYSGKFNYRDPRFFELLKKEKKEQIFRAWVNKETITAAGATISAVGLLISVPLSGGATSVAALPLSIRLLQVGAQVTSLTAKSIFISLSVLKLSDQYKKDGWEGLLNVETAIDLLGLYSLLPGVPSTLFKAGVDSNVFKALTFMQGKGAFYTSIVYMIGQAAYTLHNLEEIAKKTNKTTGEVREGAIESLSVVMRFISGMLVGEIIGASAP